MDDCKLEAKQEDRRWRWRPSTLKRPYNKEAKLIELGEVLNALMKACLFSDIEPDKLMTVAIERLDPTFGKNRAWIMAQ